MDAAVWPGGWCGWWLVWLVAGGWWLVVRTKADSGLSRDT
jgi:hypothetical protein